MLDIIIGVGSELFDGFGESSSLLHIEATFSINIIANKGIMIAIKNPTMMVCQWKSKTSSILNALSTVLFRPSLSNFAKNRPRIAPGSI